MKISVLPPSRREQECAAYLAANPEVWELFERFTFEAINSGATRCGSMLIVQRIRWESNIVGAGDFKISNNWAPYLARRFIRRHPEHRGFFALHKISR